MAKNDLVTYKVFGKASWPTIYYMTGYGGTIKLYKPHISMFVRNNYRVLAFEYDERVLASGKPELIVQALKYITDVVSTDCADHRVAGVYGVSLGSWFGWYVTKHNDRIERGVFNCGGDSIIRAVLQGPTMESVRKAQQKNGVDKKKLEQVWGPYDIHHDANKGAQKKILLFNSKADKIISYKEARRFFHEVKDLGGEAEHITFYFLGHKWAIIRALFYRRKTLGFFR